MVWLCVAGTTCYICRTLVASNATKQYVAVPGVHSCVCDACVIIHTSTVVGSAACVLQNAQAGGVGARNRIGELTRHLGAFKSSEG
jgi:hypothetical protein